MITAKEARGLHEKLPKETIEIFYDDIKRSARKGLGAVDVNFLQGSNIDRSSHLIIKELESKGYVCEYFIDKYMWIDWGLRRITVTW
ncbi:hypothetical protein [Vibrio phage LP.1]|nr:hypothetical protein [Vibrio phage LP.1]